MSDLIMLTRMTYTIPVVVHIVQIGVYCPAHYYLFRILVAVG